MGDTTVRAQVIIEAKDQTGPATSSAAKGMGDLNKTMSDMVKEATGVDLASLSMTGAIVGVGAALAASVKKAAEWGDEMGDLAQLTGVSAHEASKMSATFELVGVSTRTIEQALKTMTKNGLTPTIDTFKDLATQYKAIEDPAERNTFLFKNFGKAGMEMAEIMGRDTAELDKLAAAAVRSGKVIGDDAAGAAEEFNTNMAILQQRVEGAQIAIGNALVPTLNAAMTAFDQLTSIVTIETANFWQFLGIVDENTASQMKLKAAGIDPLVNEAVPALTVAISEATATNKDLADSADLVTAAQERQAQAHEADAMAAAALKIGMGELTKEMIFNAASEGLSNEAKLQLAVSMGLVSEKAVDTSNKIQALKQKYDANRDGVISATEATSGYIAELNALQAKIENIPDRTVTVKVVVVGDTAGGIGDAKKDEIGQLRTSNFSTNRQIVRGAGGPIYAGQATIVGDAGPELVMLTGGGGTVTPLGATNNSLPVVQAQTDPDMLNLVRGLPGMIRRAFQDALAGA